MKLHHVNEGITKYKKRRRIGRGTGSGHGKTAGKGHKGQKWLVPKSNLSGWIDAHGATDTKTRI